MGLHGRSQSRQLHVGHTIVLMEDQAYLDFVELIANELQAGLTLDTGMLRIIDAERRLETVPVGNQFKLNISQYCEH
ncbi:hypothetical protein ExPCM16_00100 [Escherichia coli]|nr:hypothetical protein ExPCM16_00100 [Escherichia coli]